MTADQSEGDAGAWYQGLGFGSGREAALPVVYVLVAFAAEADAGIIWREKVPAVSRCLLGTDRVEIHPTVRPMPGERGTAAEVVTALGSTTWSPVPR